jgi:hypothetical protein
VTAGPPEPPLPLLWRAFGVTQGVLLAVGWAMRPDVPARGAEPFSWLLVGLTLAVTALWVVAPRLVPPDEADAPRSRAVARWVCAEAVGVFGLAVLAHGGPAWIGTALVGWGLALVLAAPPEP